MTRFLMVLVLLVLVAFPVAAQSVPEDLLGLRPAVLQTLLPSQNMEVVTTSYTVTDPTTGQSLASYTATTGEALYLLGYRVGGTAQGSADVYLSATRAYRTAFFGDYSDTGWVYCPDWSSLTATAGTSLSVRATAAMSGTYSATLLVGKVE